jgi:hypothetical protein
LYSHFLSETWDRLPLSQLVTLTQALRCKEIQYSPPLDVGPSFARTRINPSCILFTSPSRLGTRSTNSLVSLGPQRARTPTICLLNRASNIPLSYGSKYKEISKKDSQIVDPSQCCY